MNTQFKTLFTLGVVHGYYGGQCEDVTFVIPQDTRQRLLNGKMLSRTREGRLYLLCETDDAGRPLISLSGKTLRFGLRLANSYFANFTADFTSTGRLYRNASSPNRLDPAAKVQSTGPVFTHRPTNSTRPVTLRLKNASGQVLRSDDLTTTGETCSVSYDLTGQTPGAYTIEELYGSGTKPVAYYLDPELVPAGVFAVVEISVTDALYAAQADFQLSFAARQETLNYYVVVATEQAADLNPLKVKDAGFTEELRPEIQFTKIPSAQFTSAEIAPALLGDSSRQVVLFRSKSAVARTAQGRKKIQLLKNGDVLIANLPQPGPEKNHADMIIPVSKL